MGRPRETRRRSLMGSAASALLTEICKRAPLQSSGAALVWIDASAVAAGESSEPVDATPEGTGAPPGNPGASLVKTSGSPMNSGAAPEATRVLTGETDGASEKTAAAPVDSDGPLVRTGAASENADARSEPTGAASEETEERPEDIGATSLDIPVSPVRTGASSVVTGGSPGTRSENDGGFGATTGARATTGGGFRPQGLQRDAEGFTQRDEVFLAQGRAADPDAERGRHAVAPRPPEAVAEEPRGRAREEELPGSQTARALGELLHLARGGGQGLRSPFAGERAPRGRAHLRLELGRERGGDAVEARVPAPSTLGPARSKRLQRRQKTGEGILHQQASVSPLPFARRAASPVSSAGWAAWACASSGRRPARASRRRRLSSGHAPRGASPAAARRPRSSRPGRPR
jgi:hypothetical protein